MEHYLSELTRALILALSIGNSQPETVWFWVRGALIYSIVRQVVSAFV